MQLLGSWYILAVASSERDFVLEKDTRIVEGVVVTLSAENGLKVLSSRLGPDGCNQMELELQQQDSGWVFQNPSLGVLQYRVLGTNFRDYAIVFTQLELEGEAFNTVELYSRTETASEEALQLFNKWSKDLGFWAHQQAKLQRDFTCAQRILQQ
ncbi:PREDICTED: epididymal-specific lipocalin-6 [Chinchilla lanigera]|uniref:epididymal-specific lipocalin-6 n=1 Tax=Chinchilla lanigera TaxID=34839 RepID=UPI0006983E75|nr:PREDICTED: epididymal-specific lipocalin-6 [Chinchilla lanigera]